MSESMLSIARRREIAPGSAPLAFARADALDLPFGDGTFDAVVSTQVLEYVDDIAAALAEARRVLRPGGRLLDPRHRLGLDRLALGRRGAHARAYWPRGTSTSPTPPAAPPAAPARRGRPSTWPSCAVIPILNRGYDPRHVRRRLDPASSPRSCPGARGVDAEEAAGVGRRRDRHRHGRVRFSLNRDLFVAVRSG